MPIPGQGQPRNLSELLTIRKNSPPRSSVGQFVSRMLFALNAVSRRNLLKRHYGRLGARLDRYFPVKPIMLPTDMASELRQDWKEVLHLIGVRRGRDLSILLQA